MPLIILSENNSLSRKVLKSPFPEEDISIFELPFRKMTKRSLITFKKRLSSANALFFSDISMESILPGYEIDTKTFFNSVIIKILPDILKAKNLTKQRLVIFDPDESTVLYAIDNFSDVALSGSEAMTVSSHIFENTGAPIPVVSGCSEKDIALCLGNFTPLNAGFTLSSDIKTGVKTLGGDSLKFYPSGKYVILTPAIKRPLNLKEAALLSEYDKKATFNIVF